MVVCVRRVEGLDDGGRVGNDDKGFGGSGGPKVSFLVG